MKRFCWLLTSFLMMLTGCGKEETGRDLPSPTDFSFDEAVSTNNSMPEESEGDEPRIGENVRGPAYIPEYAAPVRNSGKKLPPELQEEIDAAREELLSEKTSE